MKTCFFHAGMSKTGSSSIQSALYYQLDDPRFQYVSFGEINGSRGIATLFSEDPLTFPGNEMLGVTAASLGRYRNRLLSRAHLAIRRASRRDADLVVSAESGWRMSAAGLANMRSFFNGHGYQVRVVVYLRPWLPWLSSSLQEQLKHGQANLADFISRERLLKRCDYVIRVDNLVHVFGADHVECRPYIFDKLHAGCVVQDFFRSIGANASHPHAEALNPSLGVEACKLLYHYNRQHGRRKAGRLAYAKRLRLFAHLSRLGGPPLRLHPAVFQSIVPFLEDQRRRLLEAHGVSLPLESDREPAGPCIRDEPDLLDTLPSTMEWLARETRTRPRPHLDSTERSRQIGDLMATLARRFGAADWCRWIGTILRREWRHVTTAA